MVVFHQPWFNRTINTFYTATPQGQSGHYNCTRTPLADIALADTQTASFVGAVSKNGSSCSFYYWRVIVLLVTLPGFTFQAGKFYSGYKQILTRSPVRFQHCFESFRFIFTPTVVLSDKVKGENDPMPGLIPRVRFQSLPFRWRVIHGQSSFISQFLQPTSFEMDGMMTNPTMQKERVRMKRPVEYFVDNK